MFEALLCKVSNLSPGEVNKNLQNFNEAHVTTFSRAKHACAAQDCCSSSTCSSLRRRQACSHPSLRMLPASPNNCHQICNKAMRQALCYIREDTATRYCGKTQRQGNTAGAAERLSGRYCGFACGKAQRQNIAAGITARRHHDKTLRQKYTAALWQESATCGKKVRHVSWHCGMLLRLNRKKRG